MERNRLHASYMVIFYQGSRRSSGDASFTNTIFKLYNETWKIHKNSDALSETKVNHFNEISKIAGKIIASNVSCDNEKTKQMFTILLKN